ncbi:MULTISPECIES: hypothetical protein [unclassified Lactobacillus]|uniref:hypothetical protein n=1 Tax=unclassified Lactobacillus TaxID=2620435 RepID=UPI000EFCBED9|nr:MULTISPECIES: hypothetical protein [unclassified Lactobacillus]RMC23442.1 hypothetical protein F5ESL0247_07995 [Lactobacillus sp. ESL0247]RMC27032.1 hypothetical protein F5ESL0246_07995 [Lactobacillus sp. ESL0246]RMC30237.1 hypothetical protein F5ESL0245_07995 [Lactobacillus sp. ESL0245]RMC47399.1 hypothetical protein F5ESL0228_08120 [Lactobacillus sp. ESL0228]
MNKFYNNYKVALSFTILAILPSLNLIFSSNYYKMMVGLGFIFIVAIISFSIDYWFNKHTFRTNYHFHKKGIAALIDYLIGIILLVIAYLFLV